MTANESHDTIIVGRYASVSTPITAHFSRWTTSSRHSTTEHVSITVEYGNGKWDEYEGKNTWYNRPWQEFTYQTASVVAARKMLDEATARELEAWKSLNGYERMNEKRREEWRDAKPFYWYPDEEHAIALCVYMLAKNDFTRPEYAPVISMLSSYTTVMAVGDGVYAFRCPKDGNLLRRIRWNSRMGQYHAGAFEVLE